jgi:uncharacterized protein YodC (DUF2158 family)
LSFEVGDIVQLNSGGEKMTVVKFEDNMVVCNYFIYHSTGYVNRVEWTPFPEKALKKVEE